MFAVCCVVFVMSSCSCCWFSLNCVLVVMFCLSFFALFMYVICQSFLNVIIVVWFVIGVFYFLIVSFFFVLVGH